MLILPLHQLQPTEPNPAASGGRGWDKSHFSTAGNKLGVEAWERGCNTVYNGR